MHTSIEISLYTQWPTCFDCLCGHLQGSKIRKMNTLKIIKLNYWSMHFVVPPPFPAPRGPGPPHCRVFTMTLGHTTLGRTPLREWSARRREDYVTTNNTHQRQTAMPPAGLETSIPASDLPQTNALDRAAPGIGFVGIAITYTGLSKKMDGIWNRYNLKSIGRIYTFGVLKCSEKFKVLDLP